MKEKTRLARATAALIMCFVVLGTMSTTAASAAPAAAASTGAELKPPPARAKLSAKLLDTKVKVNAKARIQGRLDVLVPMRAGPEGLELVVVQELRAGVWIDLQPARCQPNIRFTVAVSFSISARYTLRVFHPTSSLASEAFVLAVLP